MDGGDPGLLYYFVGPGVGQAGNGEVGGWVACGPDVSVGVWKNVVCYLQQSDGTPDAPIGGLSPSFTRYLIDTIAVPFLSAGAGRNAATIEVLVSEHYGAEDPTRAPGMERFFYAAGWGKVRWEGWGTGTPSNELAQRAPAIEYGYPTAPSLNPAHQLLDVRTYTNIVPQTRTLFVPRAPMLSRPLSIADFGWPPNFVLP